MTLHTWPSMEQGSPEWHDIRRGLVTASTVGRLLAFEAPNAVTVDCPKCKASAGSPCISLARKEPTPVKTYHPERSAITAEMPHEITVADNETSRGLTATLAAERVTGFTEDTPMTSDMFRGVLCEPIARDLYSGHYQQAEEFGFFLREEAGWKLGFSPDGLVGTDGLLEVKSPRAKTHFRTILAGEVPAHYLAQCMAGLLVSGRDWVDFCSYVSGMPLLVLRVFPDQEWFDAITAACIRFEANVNALIDEYEAKAKHLPKTDRIAFDDEIRVA